MFNVKKNKLFIMACKELSAGIFIYILDNHDLLKCHAGF